MRTQNGEPSQLVSKMAILTVTNTFTSPRLIV